MRIVLAIVSITFGLSVPACLGQGLPDQSNFAASNLEGFHLYGVSGFMTYSSFDFPTRATNSNTPSLDSRASYGASGTVGWERLHGRTNAAARYTGSFTGDSRYSDFNRFNHSLMLTVNREFGPKWSASIAANARDMTIEQFVFEPSTLGTLTQTGASFDDMAAAMSVGQYTNSQTQLLTSSAPGAFSAANSALLGSHILSYGVQASVTYEHSSRLSFHIGSFAMGGEHRSSSQTPTVNDNYIMPRTLGGDLGVSMNYALSPRTELGLNVSENYVNSRFQQSYGTATTASIGRKMGRSWFVRAYGGGSFIQDIRQAYGTVPMRQAIWGGSIGFRTRSNMLAGTYTRSGYDLSNSALGKSTIISAAWSWRPYRSNWGLNADLARTETTNTGYTTLSGWHATAGLSRTLGSNFGLLANYSYVNSRGLYLGIANQVIVDGFRVSVTWSPKLRHETSAVSQPEEEK